MTLPHSIEKLIEELFKTQTIKPSYRIPDILYAIMLLGKANEKGKGMGRYKLRQKIGLGGGSIKTLVGKLKEQDVIDVSDKKQRGHFLTKKGKKIYEVLTEVIPVPQRLKDPKNEIVLGDVAHYTWIKSKYVDNHNNIGIKQRDASIKIGGEGATCLEFNGEGFVFPGDQENQFSLSLDAPEFKELREKDVLIIGGASKKNLSVIATIAAALSLFD